MLGFLFRVAAGTVKLGVKYILVPAIVSVAITMAAEVLAESIRERTPDAQRNGAARRPRKLPARTAIDA